MSEKRTVLVLGGGVGGLVAATELRKLLPATHRVVLVDREERHLFAPSLLWLMIGLRRSEKVSRPLVLLRKKGIEVVLGEIERIDPLRRAVIVAGEELVADHVVISLGAELAPETVPGLVEAGHNFYTEEGAASLRDALRGFYAGRLVVLTSGLPYKCPAAPYEAAMLLEYDCRKRKVREDVRVDLYAAEARPMGVAGPETSGAVREMVEGKGIGYHPSHQVVRVDPAARTLHFTNGLGASFDLLAYVPPHRVPRVVRDAGMVGEGGWMSVDRHTLETSFDEVYAIGDIAGIPLALGKPLPKAGVFAHAQAVVVARNIARSITGKGKPASFDGRGECFIETGDGKAGFARGEFYAEPVPELQMFNVGRHWHAGKVLFEKEWLRRYF